MAQLKEFFEVFNFHTFVYSLFLLFASFIFVYEVSKKICSIFGIRFKHLEARDKQTKKIDEIEKKQIDIEEKLNSLTKIVIDDRVDRMRYEILDMASAISENNRWYSVEQIKHTLKVYDEYEKFLKEHNLENGEVDLSISIIKKAYTEKYVGMKS